jgi:hypothetical protein
MIIVVGNGSSLIDIKNGSRIDSFEKVIRFNSFKTKGFEDFVGIKTTSWVTCNACHIDKKFNEVIYHSWTHDKNKDPIFLNLQEKFPNIISLDLGLIKEANLILEKVDLKAPSTGLLAILHFLKTEQMVTITGFDWWSRSAHHYGDNEVRGTIHKPDLEMKRINDLSIHGKIRFL